MESTLTEKEIKTFRKLIYAKPAFQDMKERKPIQHAPECTCNPRTYHFDASS